MTREKDGQEVSQRGRINDAVISLGVWALSDSMTLRESWRATRSTEVDDGV